MIQDGDHELVIELEGPATGLLATARLYDPSSAQLEETKRERVVLPPPADDVAVEGRQLSEAIFSDTAFLAALRTARARVAETRGSLYIRLFAPDDVLMRRWECLTDPSPPAGAAGRRLFSGTRVCFTRSLGAPAPAADRVAPASTAVSYIADTTAFVAIAAPAGADAAVWPDPVDRDCQRTVADDALRRFGAKVIFLEGAFTIDRFSTQLSAAGADLVYVLCHGRWRRRQGPMLLLETIDGGPDVVSGARLVDAIAGQTRRPALVYLASCESAGAVGGGAGLAAIGPEIVRRAEVPAVISMLDRVQLATASSFANAFFSTLGQKGKVMAAMTVARDAIADRADWWSPVLCTSAGVNRLFDKDDAADQALTTMRDGATRNLESMNEYFGVSAELYVYRNLELEIETFLRSTATCMVISGQSGMGKSTLLAKVLAERHRCHDLCRFISSGDLDPGRLTDGDGATTFVDLIADSVTGGRQPSLEFWGAIERTCERRDRQCIIAIDAVNEFGRAQGLAASDSVIKFLRNIDLLVGTIQQHGWRRIKILITSRPEVWGRGKEAARARMRDSANAYHVSRGELAHVLEHYTEVEASKAFERYRSKYVVTTTFDALSPLVRLQLHDPLLLRLTCQTHEGSSIPDELDSAKVFEGWHALVRAQPAGAVWLATVDQVVRAMFDADDEVIERDSLALDGDLRTRDPQLFDALSGQIGEQLASDLSIIRRDGGVVRFVYDRYAEYRLSERLLARIRSVQKSVARRTKYVMGLIRRNLARSFHLTTVFRALRRVLRELATREPKFAQLLIELAADERGLSLVVSALSAIAMRPTANGDGIELVNAVLEALMTRAKRLELPVIDIVYRLLLDPEYRAWLEGHEASKPRHYRVLDQPFVWAIRDHSGAVSAAAVQYLFFLWRTPSGRPHATRITEALVAAAPRLWSALIGKQRKAYLSSLTGAFMLSLAEAPTADDAAPILELGRKLVLALDPAGSLVFRSLERVPQLLERFFARNMLEDNVNPVNFEAVDAWFRDSFAQEDMSQSISLIADPTRWEGATAERLLPLAETPNAVSLQVFCFALSTRWERLAVDGRGRDQQAHLRLLSTLFLRGQASARYALALALYHINYFGEHGTRETVEMMTEMARTLLADGQGRFRFADSERRYDTNIIGTLGRVMSKHARALGPSRQIERRPQLDFALQALAAARDATNADDYEYVCESVGLLGTLTEPSQVFDVTRVILADLWPDRFQSALTRPSDIHRIWSAERIERIRLVTLTSLANIRVLYRSAVDSWLLDELADQALYTDVSTRIAPSFHLATFYSWTTEHLVYRMLTRYLEPVGNTFLAALEEAARSKGTGNGILCISRGLFECLHTLAMAPAS